MPTVHHQLLSDGQRCHISTTQDEKIPERQRHGVAWAYASQHSFRVCSRSFAGKWIFRTASDREPSAIRVVKCTRCADVYFDAMRVLFPAAVIHLCLRSLRTAECIGEVSERASARGKHSRVNVLRLFVYGQSSCQSVVVSYSFLFCFLSIFLFLAEQIVACYAA